MERDGEIQIAGIVVHNRIGHIHTLSLSLSPSRILAPLQSDHYRSKLVLSAAQENAQGSLDVRRQHVAEVVIVQQRVDLLVELAHRAVRPLAIAHGLLPALAQGRRRDADPLGCRHLWLVQIRRDLDELPCALRLDQRCRLVAVGKAVVERVSAPQRMYDQRSRLTIETARLAGTASFVVIITVIILVILVAGDRLAFESLLGC